MAPGCPYLSSTCNTGRTGTSTTAGPWGIWKPTGSILKTIRPVLFLIMHKIAQIYTNIIRYPSLPRSTKIYQDLPQHMFVSIICTSLHCISFSARCSDQRSAHARQRHWIDSNVESRSTGSWWPAPAQLEVSIAMGVPPAIIHFWCGFSMTILGYPHGYGNPQLLLLLLLLQVPDITHLHLKVHITSPVKLEKIETQRRFTLSRVSPICLGAMYSILVGRWATSDAWKADQPNLSSATKEIRNVVVKRGTTRKKQFARMLTFFLPAWKQQIQVEQGIIAQEQHSRELGISIELTDWNSFFLGKHTNMNCMPVFGKTSCLHSASFWPQATALVSWASYVMKDGVKWPSSFKVSLTTAPLFRAWPK